MNEKKGRCIIITGGQKCRLEERQTGDFILACDRGYDYAWEEGLWPDLVVGDFDSCGLRVADGIPVLKYPVEKDDTDTMIGIRYAVEHGMKEVVIYCGLGGRLDHTFANLQAMAFAAEHGLTASLKSNDTMVYMLKGGQAKPGYIRLAERRGWSVSLFSFSSRCEHITTKGLKYTLTDDMMVNDFPLGVSNEWAEEWAEITVGEGLLLIILSKK